MLLDRVRKIDVIQVVFAFGTALQKILTAIRDYHQLRRMLTASGYPPGLRNCTNVVLAENSLELFTGNLCATMGHKCDTQYSHRLRYYHETTNRYYRCNQRLGQYQIPGICPCVPELP